VDFHNVIVGQKNTQTIQISNLGKANLDITGVSLVGAGFSLSPVTTPMQLAPGASKSLTLSFTPTSATTVKGNIIIASDDPHSPLSILVQGAGEQAAASWQMIPSSFTFGTTNIQTSSTENASIKNTGNISVTISAVAISGSGFSTSGLSTGITLAPNQQVNFQVNFRPTSSGYVTGTLNVSTLSTTTPLTMALAGTGSSATAPLPQHHSVSLSWDPSSSSNVAGYRVYRGGISGGPYSLLTSSLVPGTNYTDASVLSGNEYFYVTTAVDSSGDESVYSNEAAATIPSL
jgi:trimeric autotransporter adhesin